MGRFSISRQYVISTVLIIVIAVSSFFSVDYIGYRVVALMLLVAVSIIAMLFDILPVLLTAVLSALIWNFFFIPPIFNFHIGTPEDVLMFLMYFFIALINAVLTFKIREFEKKARDKEEKENTIKLYNTLLNSLSHELRTPIATIIGAVDTINENKERLTEQQREELLHEIEIASFRLNLQVENLLNMSRLETGTLKLTLDWTDINEMIFAILKNIKTSDISHIIKFEPIDTLPLYKIDRGLMEQVLYNLLYNAIHHTPGHTTIIISASSVASGCQIIVEDNGIGFPENELTEVFKKFYRLPATGAKGTGLGLSIAKGFVEAHNGTIRLENKKAGGAKFTIVLPSFSSPISEEF